MKRHLFLLICLLATLHTVAQTQTDSTVEAIMQFLNSHCVSGYATFSVRGHDKTMYGQYRVENRPVRATGALLDSISPFINQLPHKRRMTDEQADEIFRGRIAMRLRPEKGDTSAYFLMDYDRQEISFKYGVNSPRSINIFTENSLDMHPDFSYRDLPADSVAPVNQLLAEMEQRSNAVVVDTVFQYVEGEANEWWFGDKGEASRTPAHLVLLPDARRKDFQTGDSVFSLLAGSRDVILYKVSTYWRGLAMSENVVASFCSGGMFCFYHIGYFNQCLCMIRIVVPTWQQCARVPITEEIVNRFQGKASTPRKWPKEIAPEAVQRLDSLLTTLHKRPDAQAIDTLFKSNDFEGHAWWVNIDAPCPTKATVIRTRCTQEDYTALCRQLEAIAADPDLITSNQDDVPRFFMLRWCDSQQRYHAIVFYLYADGQLAAIRADGEHPESICIPHYNPEWFDLNP